MKKRLTLWPLAFLLASATFTASAADAAEKQALITVEHRWVQALAAGDTATLARILAPDFIDISWRGRLRGRAAVLAGQAAPPSTTQTMTDLKARIYGGVGIVNGLNEVGAGNRRWQVRFTDVFVKRDGRWRAVSAQETLVNSTGRPQ